MSYTPEPDGGSLTALRIDLQAVVAAGIAAVGAGRLVDQALDARPELEHARRVWVVSAGKAAASMAAAAARRLGSRIHAGLIVSPSPAAASSPFELIVGGHPLPTSESERAGRRALALTGSGASDEVVLCLLSGGASALMAVPAEGVSLTDKQATTNLLLRAGADIAALNTVRKHLSAVKGGRLAVASRGPCHTLAVSDVVGDDLGVIGSGPTVGDASRFGDAEDVLRRFGGLDAYPPAVVAHVAAGIRGDVPETPKPSDPRLSRTTATVIGGRVNAMDGACREAERLGYLVIRIDEPVVGEARVAAAAHLHTIAERIRGAAGRVCVVSSGETTVRVLGAGKGGRNQEFVLAAVEGLRDFGERAVITSVGTDGVDGPTDAAGAVADTTTSRRARSAGLSADDALHDNDSHTFFAALGDLIVTGHTDTNVGDLQVFLGSFDAA